ILATALGGLMAAGLAWGYLAAVSPALDFLQPGRHTYALYTSAALAAGAGLGELFERLRRFRPRIDIWAALGLGLIGFRLFGPAMVGSVSYQLALRGAGPSHGQRFGGEPFLSSKPTGR